ncbi:MAG: NAD(P)H-quinone oxidoreductase [Mycobacteriaceae bacterium]|nr:NAD(P)H-quinone oxidoreductase [Mycobacteriaceae bacterium]
MRAICLSGHGGPEVMTVGAADEPTPGPDEVVVDVVAAGVNRADVLQRLGLYPPPPGASEILGLECSGIIAAVGERVHGWSVGDRVCALLSGGGYAERVAVPATALLSVPESVDLVSAAGLPEVACTVWSNLVMAARLGPRQRLLVHGGGSGVGTHAIQVALALGAEVAVTAGSRHKLERCRDLGAKLLVNYRDEDFVAAVRAWGGADVILDNMGAAYLERNVEALAPDGRLVVVGLQGGVAGPVNLAALMAKRGTIHAAGLRARADTGDSSKAEIVAEVERHLWPLIADGVVLPVIHAVLPIAEAPRAHELLDSPDTVGKVLLTV